MIRALYRTADGQVRTDLRPTDYSKALRDPDGLLWVDLGCEPPEVCEPILRDTFRFHPLAVDDALQESHVPKLDDWDEYLYIVLHSVHFEAEALEQISTREVDLFVGGNFLVTHREHPNPALDAAWSSCQRDARQMARGCEHLLYRLVDELVGAHLPVIDAIDEEVESLEERILARPTPKALERTLNFKRSLLLLRRIIAPQREVLNRLARDRYAVIRPEHRVYFRDIYDHLVRLYDITENMRDLVAGALEIYLSVINNRMNEVMKTLTLITTLFMPISFIVGFFGMNFFGPVLALPGWTGRLALWITLGALALTPFLMFLWLRLRRWV